LFVEIGSGAVLCISRDAGSEQAPADSEEPPMKSEDLPGKSDEVGIESEELRVEGKEVSAESGQLPLERGDLLLGSEENLAYEYLVSFVTVSFSVILRVQSTVVYAVMF